MFSNRIFSNRIVNNLLKFVYIFNLCARQVAETHAGILPLAILRRTSENLNAPVNLEKFGYIEYKPNGTIILRSTMEAGSNLPNLLLFKTVLNAMKMSPAQFVVTNANAVPNNVFNIKIYGDGIEHKFPPFLERIVQRIQSYFSVYRYTDTSRPPHPILQESQTNVINSINLLTMNQMQSTTTAAGMGVGAAGMGVGVGDITDTEEGSGSSVISSDLPNTSIVNIHAFDGNEDYPEFIAIEGDDDYITVH